MFDFLENTDLISQGQQGSNVGQLQSFLNTAGFNVGAQDSIFGGQTAQGLRDFQASQGIGVDAIVGPETRAAIRNFLAAQQQQQTTPEPTVDTATGGVPAVDETLGTQLGQFSFDTAPSQLDQALQDRLNQFQTAAGANVDEAQIRADTLARFQAQIDSLNQIFNQQLAQKRLEGRGRVGSGTAALAARGLTGSGRGMAQQEKILGFNTAIESDVIARKNAAIASVMSAARNTADAEIAARTAAKEEGAQSFIEFLSAQEQRQGQKTSQVIQAMINQGVTPDEIPDEQLRGILSDLGIKEEALKSQFTELETQAEIERLAAEDAKANNLQGTPTFKDFQQLFGEEGTTEQYLEFVKLVAEAERDPSKGRATTGSGGSPVGLISTDNDDTNDLNLAARTVASTITSKFGQESFIRAYESLINRGLIEDAKHHIKNAAIRQLPSTQQDDMGTRRQIIESINVMRDTIQGMEDRGLSTGLFKGKKEKIKRKLGNQSDPELTRLSTQIKNALDLLARDRTGAAMTPKEEDFYRQLFPETTNKFDLNVTVLDALLEEMEREDNIRLGFVLDPFTQGVLEPAGAIPGSPQSTQGTGIQLRDPQSGEIRAFTNLSLDDIKEALAQGFTQV